MFREEDQTFSRFFKTGGGSGAFKGGSAINTTERKAVGSILTAWTLSIIFLLIKGNLLNSLMVKGVDIDLVIIFTVYFLASNESSPGLSFPEEC